ncbi:MAG: hypothetical protein ACPLKP_03275 [Microgenomates group bacterium]
MGQKISKKEKSPNEIAKQFHWDFNWLNLNQSEKEIDNFLANQSKFFPSNPQKILEIFQDGISLTNKAWQTLFPQSPPLYYHNQDHAVITGIITFKLFLGAIVYHQLKISRAENLIQLIYLVSLFHEINDWWNLPSLRQEKGYSQRFNEVKNLILHYFKENQLSSFDFNRLLLLNNFNKSPLEGIFEAKNLNPKDKENFLPLNNVPSLIDSLSSSYQNLLWQIFSNCLNAADFFQVLNPAHKKEVNILVGNKIYPNKRQGAVVLAVECQKIRPKALKKLGWANKEGKIDWNKVKTTKEFLIFAKERIKPALPYLEFFKRFSSSEK